MVQSVGKIVPSKSYTFITHPPVANIYLSASLQDLPFLKSHHSAHKYIFYACWLLNRIRERSFRPDRLRIKDNYIGIVSLF